MSPSRGPFTDARRFDPPWSSWTPSFSLKTGRTFSRDLHWRRLRFMCVSLLRLLSNRSLNSEHLKFPCNLFPPRWTFLSGFQFSVMAGVATKMDRLCPPFLSSQFPYGEFTGSFYGNDCIFFPRFPIPNLFLLAVYVGEGACTEVFSLPAPYNHCLPPI